MPNWRRILGQHSTTVQLLLMQVVAAGSAFIVNILAASAMEPEGRGYLALLIQITYVVTVAAVLGVDRPFIAARRRSFTGALSELMRLLKPSFIGIALLAGCVGLLFVGSTKPIAVAASLILLYLLGNVCARLIRTSYIASGRIAPFVLVSVATQAVVLVGAVVLFLMEASSPEIWFAVYGASGLIALVVTGAAVIDNRKMRADKNADRAIRLDGLRLLPASFGNTAMLRSDRLLLPLLASNAQLGFYVVVATTMELASWPVQNWVDASLNRWRGSRSETAGRIKMLLVAVAVTGVLALIMGMVSFLMIRMFLDPAYAASEALIIPLGVATVFYAASRIQQGIMIANGGSKFVSWAEIIGMVVSVLGYLVLIPILGALGAAYASVVGYAACLIAGLLLHSRSIKGAVSNLDEQGRQ